VTRIRNVSPFGELIIAGHGVVAPGGEIETDDKTLIESPNFEQVSTKAKSATTEGNE
jgi:hypothetical protein